MQPRVPSPIKGVDVRKLPLSPTEGFVLSRVDGSASVEDISMMSGIESNKLLGILDRLAELGAVELTWLPKRNKVIKPAAEAPTGGAAPDAHFARGATRYQPSALEEASVDLDKNTRSRILNAFHAIEGRDLYQLLGVGRKADKKEIRNAYFELSKVFHPDAYFGKQLGGFKPKMETVFKRLTEAYEVLGKVKKRAEYDDYLLTTEQTRRTRRTLDSFELSQPEVQAHRDKYKKAEPKVEPPPPPPSSDELAASAALKAPRVPTEAKAAPSAPRIASTEERRARVRDRLRQRLRSSNIPPPPAAPEVPTTPEQRRHSAIEGLRTSLRAAVAISSEPTGRVASHMQKARDAEQAGDVLRAATELQVALQIEPNDVELLREYERVSKVVSRSLAANYEKQALYEEKTAKWDAAGRSWARVADGRPEDPNAARRAAEAMLKASGDLHRAQQYAQAAVNLDKNSVENLTVLARVYLAAGLKLNALRELEKAKHLAPKDEMVNNLLREAR